MSSSNLGRISASAARDRILASRLAAQESPCCRSEKPLTQQFLLHSLSGRASKLRQTHTVLEQITANNLLLSEARSTNSTGSHPDLHSCARKAGSWQHIIVLKMAAATMAAGSLSAGVAFQPARISRGTSFLGAEKIGNSSFHGAALTSSMSGPQVRRRSSRLVSPRAVSDSETQTESCLEPEVGQVNIPPLSDRDCG